MDIIEKLYRLFDESVENSLKDIDGKICVPISGGLDSRITAGLIAKKRKIDLSFTAYNAGGYIKHIGYAKQIAKVTGTPCPWPIGITQEERKADHANLMKLVPNANPGGRTYTVLRKVNDLVPLKYYHVFVPLGLEFLTGIHVNPYSILFGNIRKFDREWEENHYNKIEKVAQEKLFGYFCKTCINPFWNEPLKTFCLNLPHRYRIHQYAYRQVFKRCFPELAEIPREWMDIPMNVGELGYVWGKVKYIWKKRGLKRGKRIPFI